MNRYVNPGVLSVWDARLERQFSEHLATIPAPLPPKRDPGVVDVTPDTLGDRATVAHIREWNRQRKLREATRIPSYPSKDGKEL